MVSLIRVEAPAPGPAAMDVENSGEGDKFENDGEGVKVADDDGEGVKFESFDVTTIPLYMESAGDTFEDDNGVFENEGDKFENDGEGVKVEENDDEGDTFENFENSFTTNPLYMEFPPPGSYVRFFLNNFNPVIVMGTSYPNITWVGSV